MASFMANYFTDRFGRNFTNYPIFFKLVSKEQIKNLYITYSILIEFL